jgi:hypothetical protein
MLHAAISRSAWIISWGYVDHSAIAEGLLIELNIGSRDETLFDAAE